MFDLIDAYRFGSLLDAVITEPEKVSTIEHTPAELLQCKAMFQSFLKQPFCAQVHKSFDKQFELYCDDLPFEYNGVKFKLPFKMRADFRRRPFMADLKSTACTTQKSFEAACEQFDYDRQAAVYMKMTGDKSFMLIGVSKVKPYNVFQVAIKDGDERHKSGVEKMNELAFKMWVLAA